MISIKYNVKEEHLTLELTKISINIGKNIERMKDSYSGLNTELNTGLKGDVRRR